MNRRHWVSKVWSAGVKAFPPRKRLAVPWHGAYGLDVAAKVVQVFIACPDDADSGREAVEDVVATWNAEHSASQLVTLRAKHYRRSAVPILGRGDGQAVTNAQLVDAADIVFGVFFHRLGTPTPRSPSGSAEEVERAYKAGKIVHAYFLHGGPRSRSAQSASLQNFRTKLESLGLVATFDSIHLLREQVADALDHDIKALRRFEVSPDSRLLEPVTARQKAGAAAIRVGFDHARNRIELRNIGRNALEDVVIALTRDANKSRIPADVKFGVRNRRLPPFESMYCDVDPRIFTYMRFLTFEVSYEQFGEVSRYEYVVTR